MEYRNLGKTGLVVSRLCFGALTVGPLQARLSPEDGAKVIRTALNGGVNFIDTAEIYGTYPHIRKAIIGGSSESDGRDIIIASKSYAYTYQGMETSLMKAISELNVDSMGIFLMHEQESYLTIKGHWDALRALVDAKKKGLVRAVGISTHAIDAVKAAAEIDEIDVIQPLINLTGLGILDGTIEEMIDALQVAADRGKGIYAMKALGGGNLLNRYDEAVAFIKGLEFVHSVAVGMQTVEEVQMNLRVFSGEEVSENLKKKISRQTRQLIIDEWCEGCGACVKRCPQGALTLRHGKAVVSSEKCLLCGYCASVCRDFYIKVI